MTRRHSPEIGNPPQQAPKPVRRARRDEEDLCQGLLQRAFAADPPCRWIWPDDGRFRAAFPRFVSAFAGSAFERGTADLHASGSGVALWLPPGEGPNDVALEEVLRETVVPQIRDAAFAVFEQMGAFHPHEPHWHLPLVGVDPTAQGRGIGAALLAHALARSDAAGLPAYLEATSPRNVALYERFGFVALGTIQGPGGPRIVPMLRRPGGTHAQGAQ